MSAQAAVDGGFVRPPTPTGYTFTDEMWRTQTAKPPRYFSQKGGENSALTPTRPAPVYVPSDPRPRGPRTIAERAEEDDLQLWASSSSVAEYEERKRAINEKNRLDREALIHSQGDFPKFLLLPAELRWMIWKMAAEEPITVTLTVSGRRYRPQQRQRGWCGTRTAGIRDYSATAVLPPLMLVNHESHKFASAHYRRAFRGLNGDGGVLAAYPTIIKAQSRVYRMVGQDDKELVEDYID
ncbi:hypothetical protein F5Y10DRAFT_235050, partial [Nemania abortiva]